MAPSEPGPESEPRNARIEALIALAKDPTMTNLLKHKVLLSLVEVPESASGLDDTKCAKILHDAFDATLAIARRKVPAEKAFEQLTSGEAEAAYVAAAGELLGLTSNEALAIRSGKARYETHLEEAASAPWVRNRKLRAGLWIGRSVDTVEKRAERDLWPAFLVAVERRLIEDRPQDPNTRHTETIQPTANFTTPESNAQTDQTASLLEPPSREVGGRGNVRVGRQQVVELAEAIGHKA